MSELKIDMVYLWCDGSDPEFRARKNRYIRTNDIIHSNESVGEQRFFDNSELKYSLRSLEVNAPWINHVYIVTDRQVPKWLDKSYDRVTVIDHSEIMPAEFIPCFNSTVIEYFMPFIPKLSEYFLYGNDDMFFGTSVKPKDFFVDDRPIVRVKKIKRSKLLKYWDPNNYNFYGNVLNSLELLNATYKRKEYYELHHNIDSYRKSLFLNAFNRFYSEISVCFSNKFRKANGIQRILFNLDMVYSGEACLRIVKDPSSWKRKLSFFRKVEWESFCGNDSSTNTHQRILKYHPMFFCLNSDSSCDGKAKIRNKEFMEVLFPKKSKFEV